MVARLVIVLLLAIGICVAEQSTMQSSYLASVVEFSPADVTSQQLTRAQALVLMNGNLDRYDVFMQVARQNGVQVIVFPEYGIQGNPPGNDDWTRDGILPFCESIPNPITGTNPCLQQALFADAPITIRCSCMARTYGLPLVVDVGDVVRNCTPKVDNCRDDRRLQYNTALAFDSNGTLLAKYHKQHLYGEDGWYDIEPESKQHPAAFAIPSIPGVAFQMFICFDIFFSTIVATDVLFPTDWDNSFDKNMNATTTQLAFSSVHQVNLLASNIGTNYNSSGSGIYSFGNVLAIWNNLSPNPIDKQLFASLPIIADHVEVEFEDRGLSP